MEEKKYTLSEAVGAVEALVGEVAILLSVAAQDVIDIYGIADIDPEVFDSSNTGAFKGTVFGRRFARMLVERIIYSDDLILDYVPLDEEEK